MINNTIDNEKILEIERWLDVRLGLKDKYYWSNVYRSME